MPFLDYLSIPLMSFDGLEQRQTTRDRNPVYLKGDINKYGQFKTLKNRCLVPVCGTSFLKLDPSHSQTHLVAYPNHLWAIGASGGNIKSAFNPDGMSRSGTLFQKISGSQRSALSFVGDGKPNDGGHSLRRKSCQADQMK